MASDNIENKTPPNSDIDKESSPAVVGGIKARSITSKKRILIMGLIIALLASLVIAYIFIMSKSEPDNTGKVTTVIDGKEYDGFLTGQSVGNTNVSPSLDKQINELEVKNSFKPPTHNDYLALAQLYLMSKNYPKAVENYTLAKQTAIPEMDNYESFIAMMDKNINSLKDKE